MSVNNLKTQTIKFLHLNQSMNYPEDKKNKILKRLGIFNRRNGTNIQLDVKCLTNNRKNHWGETEYYRITIKDNLLFNQFRLEV